MKTYLLYSVFAFLSFSAFASSNSSFENQARKWVHQKPVRFIENKGQLRDTENKPVPFVLFKVASSGMNIYVTETGITYAFVRAEKVSRPSNEAETLPYAEGALDHIQTEQTWINMTLEGVRIRKENIVKEERSKERYSFFYSHCPEGVSDVYSYEKITVKDIYPGIDWVLYGTGESGMKYDFIVHPGAHPSVIKMIYESEYSGDLDEAGNIALKTRMGILTDHAPYCYLEEGKREVRSSFSKRQMDKNRMEISFNLSGYTSSATSDLILDPDLTWGTFYGGSASYEGALSIDTDPQGNIYVTGHTSSPDFPTQAGTGGFSGSYIDSTGSVPDLFILRFNKNAVLEWATYYGGSGSDNCESVICDSLGNVYLTGLTTSSDFPTQPGAGPFTGAYYDGSFGGPGSDAFILRFNINGQREWATYYGGNGSGYDYGIDITADVSGNVYVTGAVRTVDFPTQAGTGAFTGAYYDSTFSTGDYDVFILRFNTTGKLEWATMYGGKNGSEVGSYITTDALGNIYVTGSTQQLTGTPDFPTQAGIGPFAGAYYDTTYGGGFFDVFILRFNSTGVLEWATLYGGNGIDAGYTIKTDASGNIFVTGQLSSTNFPTQQGTGNFSGAYFDGTNSSGSSGYDAFLICFSNNGSLLWSTYLGGNGDERMTSRDNIAVDGNNHIYVSFLCSSADIITQQTGCGNYFSGTLQGFTDQFLMEFDNTGALKFASYLGGDGGEERSPMAIDKWNNLYLGGEYGDVMNVNTYPLKNPGGGGAYYDNTYHGQQDVFILKLSPCGGTLSVLTDSTEISCYGLCDGSLSITPAGGLAPYTYLWNTNDTTATISGLCPGVYTVTVTAVNNVSAFAATTISQPPAMNLVVSPDTSICEGENIVLTASGASSYKWYPAIGLSDTVSSTVSAFPINTTRYKITGSKDGCQDTAIVSITVNPNPIPVLTANDTLICSGDSTEICVTAGLTYLWNTGETSSCIYAKNAGGYWVTATNVKVAPLFLSIKT